MFKIMYKVMLLTVSVALVALLIGFTETQKRSSDYINESDLTYIESTETSTELDHEIKDVDNTSDQAITIDKTAIIDSKYTIDTTESLDNGEITDKLYDYSQPVPQSDAVEDSYFDDAIFVGNSRTEGFMMYSGLKNAQYLTHIGLKVDTIQTLLVAKIDGKKMTIMDALKQKEFGKIYIMLGMNELGWVFPELFKEDYALIIDEIKRNHPNSIIYMQSILPVTKNKAINDSIYNNENIERFNQLVKEIAFEKEVYYLNVSEGIADSDGSLPDNATFDGVHLKPDFCLVWLSYLKEHTVEVKDETN